jgi:hypothetical protein
MGLSTAERDRDGTRTVADPIRDRPGRAPATPAQRERDRTMTTWGSRLLAVGAALFAAGLIVTLLVDGLSDGIGAALFAFGSLAAGVGAVLLVSTFVSRRARSGKPFA